MVRLLIAAFDGLLPTQVTPELTPNIHRLADDGVRFTRHHAVFPTVTRINSAAMVTGCYSGKHGIPANRAVFPDHDPDSVLQVLQPELDALSTKASTPVLFVPTIGEILASEGMTHVSVVGGTSGNAYVHFPKAAEAGRGGVIHPEFSLPPELRSAETNMFGPWPASSVPNLERVIRVGTTTCKYVIPELSPDLLFVWFPEPDVSNHKHGLGSEQSNAGLLEADRQLGRILQELEGRGHSPDVMVVSDHGYSTITDSIDPEKELQRAGFEVNSGRGSVLVSDNGGAVLLNFPGGSETEFKFLVEWLRSQSWVGAMFSGSTAAQELGALPVGLAFADGVRAPDLLVSMAWQDAASGNGFMGTGVNAGTSPLGSGMHGSASPYELRNTLIASGPSFRRSASSGAPTGNVDVGATALHLLGLDVPEHMDGRVIREALADSGVESGPVAESVRTAGKPWHNSESGLTARYFASHAVIDAHSYLEAAGIEPATE